MTQDTSRSNQEYLFLSGPDNRWKELIRALKITLEFIKGFRQLHFVGPCITVFGSARFRQDHPYYEKAQSFGCRIAQRGFTVMTGGGPGIMEAANRGARETGGRSVGCNILLPEEQEPNPYLDLMIRMDHFYVRKVLLLKYSYSFVVMPGGFGTMDELFETLTLIQTQKIGRFPLVLFGKAYWMKLLEQIEEMRSIGTISAADTGLFLVTDSVEEGMQYILSRLRESYGREVVHKEIRSRWWLGEAAFRKWKEDRRYVIELE